MTLPPGARPLYQRIFIGARLILHCTASVLQAMPGTWLIALSAAAPITLESIALKPCMSSMQLKANSQVTHTTARIPHNCCNHNHLGQHFVKVQQQCSMLYNSREGSRCIFVYCRYAHICISCRRAHSAQECTRGYKPGSRQSPDTGSQGGHKTHHLILRYQLAGHTDHRLSHVSQLRW